jgi:hypothetical protein
VSCRTTYRNDIIAPNVAIPEIEHTGFESVEFDACFEFFHFYGLEPPSMPLMQPEFAVPGFLRLVCESLKDSGATRLPEGTLGLSQVANLLQDAKNSKLAGILDYHPRERRVQEALGILIGAMAAQSSRWLHWSDAKQIVDERWPSPQRSTSLFDHLLREGLLTEDRMVASAPTESIDIVRLSFERLTDYLLAQRYLAGVAPENVTAAFRSGGVLGFAVTDTHAPAVNAGLLEALAVILPEKYQIELPAVIGDGRGDMLLNRAVMESLIWRDSTSITIATEEVIRQALASRDTFGSAMEALMGLSARVASPVNAFWLHERLACLPLPIRDGFWCPYLHRTYGKQHGIDRLIRWALNSPMNAVSSETAELWVTQLCWFCAASDRRVRDHATKSIVRILDRHPEICSRVIRRFAIVNDEYILERCLAAAYGALIRAGDENVLAETASAVFDELFQTGRLPANVMIRDYARLILECALDRGAAPSGVLPEDFRPPYTSEWPLNFPDEAFVDRYKDSHHLFPKLYSSCLHDDFAIYTMGEAYKYEGTNPDELRRWIFKHVIDMGYDE